MILKKPSLRKIYEINSFLQRIFTVLRIDFSRGNYIFSKDFVEE